MHNLHRPNLFETRYGTVLRCECCGRVQITFRDHTLLVDEDELEVLVRTIRRALRQVERNAEMDQWKLRAGTDAGTVSIVLPDPSLRALHELLQGAWDMYVLRERLQAVAAGAESHDVLRDHAPVEGAPFL